MLVSAGAVLGTDERQRRQAAAVARASGRILNLVGTASLIASDYAFAVYVRTPEGSAREARQAAAELSAAQTDIERMGIALLKMPSAASPEAVRLQRDIDARAAEMMRLSERVAALSGEGADFSELHRRNAERLKRMCVANRGIYIKLGQHLSMLDYVLPDEYTGTLKALLSSNPHSSLASVRRVFEEDLGAPPERVFARFEERALASASLAQVHVAYDASGRKYAVKVQHLGLREACEGDMLAVTWVVAALAWLFPDFDYSFLTAEMNRNIPQELNFTQVGSICCWLARVWLPLRRRRLT